MKEKNKLESAVVSLREELKKAHTLNSDSTKLLTAEKSKNIDLVSILLFAPSRIIMTQNVIFFSQIPGEKSTNVGR